MEGSFYLWESMHMALLDATFETMIARPDVELTPRLPLGLNAYISYYVVALDIWLTSDSN